jgi:uncharacterized membrane protein YdjX (TVP38/TMEM64 family)
MSIVPASADKPPGENPGRRRLSLRRSVPVAVLVVGLVAFFALGLDDYLSLDFLKENRGALRDWVAAHGVGAGVVYAMAYAAAVALSIPGGLILTVTSGFLFGPYWGTLYVVFGATIGATILYLAARYAFADILKAKAGDAMAKMEAGFNEHPKSYLFVLRLVPLFPFWLVNIVPALLGVSFRNYVVATAFGIIPGTFVYTLVGDGAGAVLDRGGDLDLAIIFEPRFILPIAGLALLALVPVAYTKIRGRRP